MKTNTDEHKIPLRVLFIEDEPNDVELALHTLEKNGYALDYERVESVEDFEERMETGQYDIILADYSLPGWTGLDAYHRLCESGDETPLILVTGSLGDEQAVECIKAGVSDYVLKENLLRLPMAVARAVKEKALADERKQAEAKIAYQAMLLQSATDAIYSTDTNYNIKSWNKTAETMYGWQEDEVIGKYAGSLLVVDYPYHTSEDVRNQFRNEGFWEGEAIHKRKNGTYINVLASATVIKDNAGKIVGAVGISHDITQRKQIEEALRESEAKFKTIFRESLDVILIIDTQNEVILNVNPVTQRILGYENEMLKGKHFSALFPPAPQLSGAELIKKLRVHGVVFELQEFLRADGSLCPMDLTATMIPWEKGEAILVTLRDVTERKQAEEKLQYRLAFERTIATISSHFINLVPEKIDAGIQRALAALGEFAKIDCCCILLFSQNLSAAHSIHKWCATGLERQGEMFQEIALAELPWLLNRITTRDIVYLPDTEVLPAQAAVDQVWFRTRGIQSFLAVPVLWQKTVIGFLGLGSMHTKKHGEKKVSRCSNL